MPSQALFSRHSPLVTRHFCKLLALLHSFAPERNPSPSFSIPCALFLCLPGMPTGTLPDSLRPAARHRPISGHFLHFSPPERSTSPSLSIIYALFCENTGMPSRAFFNLATRHSSLATSPANTSHQSRNTGHGSRITRTSTNHQLRLTFSCRGRPFREANVREPCAFLLSVRLPAPSVRMLRLQQFSRSGVQTR
jgi:hypothetical protein